MKRLSRLLAIVVMAIILTSCKPYVIIIRESQEPKEVKATSNMGDMHIATTPCWGREVPKIIILNNQENGNKKRKTNKG